MVSQPAESHLRPLKSVDDAEARNAIWKEATRYLLLDMRDRKGWKALGHESFKAYGEKELGYQENYIYKLVNAAEISLQIGFDPNCTIVQPPPETQLRPLKSVDDAEARKAIWDEATRKAEEEHAKLTAKRIEIGKAVEAELGKRQGQRTDLASEGQESLLGEHVVNCPQVDPGQKTREVAAEKAGFDSEATYRRAKTVVEKAVLELVAADDSTREIITVDPAGTRCLPTSLRRKFMIIPLTVNF